MNISLRIKNIRLLNSKSIRMESVFMENNKIESLLMQILENQTSMQSDITGIKSDVSGLKSDVSGLKSDISELKSRVANLESGQIRIENKLNATYDHVADLTEAVTDIKAASEKGEEAYNFMQEIKNICING